MIEAHHLLIPRTSDRKYNKRQTIIANKYGFIVILMDRKSNRTLGVIRVMFHGRCSFRKRFDWQELRQQNAKEATGT